MMAESKDGKVLDITRGRRSGGRPSYVDASHSEPREREAKALGPLLESSTPVEPDWRTWFSGRRTDDVKAMRAKAREVWRRVVPELERTGVLSVVDGDEIEDYCATSAQLMVLTRRIAVDGVTHEPRVDRGPVKHPLTTVVNQLRSHKRGLARSLLLTPSARLAAGFGGAGTARPAASSKGGRSGPGEGDPFDV